jgi:hypothetical protein
VKPEKQERTVPHLPGSDARAGFNRVGTDDEDAAAACSGFSVRRERNFDQSETRRSKPDLVISL